MLTQAWGFCKIEITVWEGLVEGLALEIPPQCLPRFLDQARVSYKVISLTLCR